MDKEDYKVILDGSNMKDWIIFDEISIEGRYSISDEYGIKSGSYSWHVEIY